MNIPVANFVTRKNKKKEKEKCSVHMMNWLLNELGRAGRGNVWHSVMAQEPYAMTLGQIFFCPAL